MRDLDIEVAEKIMGWRWVEGHHQDTSVFDSPKWFLPPGMSVSDVPKGEWAYFDDPPSDRMTFANIPQYSSDIAAAWEVVELSLTEDAGYGFHSLRDGWWAGFWVTGQCSLSQANAGTAPLAICLAALDAAKKVSA